MQLTNDEIEAIANWQPIMAGFGRDDAQTGVRVQAIVSRINLSSDFGCEMLADDGLSNYFALFAFASADVPSFSLSRQVEGLLVYLSACGPVGVVGRSRKYIEPGLSSFEPLQIEALLPPDEPNGQLEELSFATIRLGGYELLSVEAVSKPLPPGVKPYEYCDSPEPWDRVFHALFGNTD